MLIRFPEKSALLEPGICFSCEKEDFVFDVGAMSPDFKCCQECIRKWGRWRLAAAADKILSLAKAEKPQISRCLHCGKEVPHDERGQYKIQCDDCTEELRLLLGGR